MEFLPQYEGIIVDFECQFKVQLKDSRISTILGACRISSHQQGSKPNSWI